MEFVAKLKETNKNPERVILEINITPWRENNMVGNARIH
jgi:hypothetical protein